MFVAFAILQTWTRWVQGDQRRVVPQVRFVRRRGMADLLREAMIAVDAPNVRPRSGTDSAEQRGPIACRKVQSGEVTRARRCLTGAALPPGTDVTFHEMQSRRPQQVQRAPSCRSEHLHQEFEERSERVLLQYLEDARRSIRECCSATILDLFFEAVSSLDRPQFHKRRRRL